LFEAVIANHVEAGHVKRSFPSIRLSCRWQIVLPIV